MKYRFMHITAGSNFPRANGDVGSGVRTAVRLLQPPNIFLTLMAYQSTPIPATRASHSEHLMKKILPTHPKKLKPNWPNLNTVKGNHTIYIWKDMQNMIWKEILHSWSESAVNRKLIKRRGNIDTVTAADKQSRKLKFWNFSP